MSEKIGWDKYETALLIDACEKVLSGKIAKATIVSELSLKLRQRAISRGMQIDDIFRNENGITLQMSKMDYLLTEGQKGLPGASRFYAEMVSLKKSNPLAFADILREAESQVAGSDTSVKNTKELFVEWLNKQQKLKYTPNAIISVFEESFEYANKHGITKVNLWDITEPAEFVAIYRKLAENRLFRIMKRKIAPILDKTHIYYKDFLSEKTVVPAVQAKEVVVVTASTAPASEKVTEEIPQVPAKTVTKKGLSLQPEKVKETLRRLSAETSRPVSVLRIYDEGVGGTLPEIKEFLENAEWASSVGNCYTYVDESYDEIAQTPDVTANTGDRIIRKKVDKSLLRAGLTVPKASSDELERLLGVSLSKGESCDITIFLENENYPAKLISVNFSEKYSAVNMLQIRYTASSPLCERLNHIFGQAFTNGTEAYLDIYVTGKGQLRFNCIVGEVSESQDEIDGSIDLENGFIKWMQNKGMAEATVRGYVSSIRSAQQYAKRNNIPGINLLSDDTAEILRSIDALLGNKEFFKYNQDQHNRFSAAFRKLRDYINELNRKVEQKSNDVALEMLYPDLYHKLYSVSKIYDDPQGLTLEHIETIIGVSGSPELRNSIIAILNGVSWATKISDGMYTFSKKVVVSVPVVEEPKPEKVDPTDFDKDAFIRVLMMRYQSGMQFDSIDFENFRDAYYDLYDEKLTFTDEELEVRIRLCGIYYSDRLFPAEGIIDSATSARLFSYIESKFAAGNNVLYYKAIFSDLADAFAYCFSLTDEKMLKAYIEFMTEEGKYYFHPEFMSTEKNVKIDHSAEIVDFMLSAGKPLSYDEIYSGLSHISKDIIYREIRWNPVFIMNEREHYFHIDIFEFSEDDGDKISEIFNKEIEENGYVVWSQIFDKIRDLMPIFLENNLYLSGLGIRNSLSVKMRDKFDFNSDVISNLGENLGMPEVYRLFAKNNAPFSDEDLYNFSKATDPVINFWSVAQETVRVSKTLFVAKDQVAFDVDAVDKALETYLSSGYILIKDVDSFLVFPNVGYEWNEFLLESFLLHYSKKFSLVNNGTSLNNVAGAIAKKDGAYTEFVNICAQALADSGIELKKTVALNYLAEIKLITRRSYKDLDVAMTRARQLRNRKG